MNRHVIITPIIFLFFVSVSVASAERRLKIVADLENKSGKTVGDYRALIIGINDYQDSEIPDLKTAVNDAEELSRVLKSSFGFKDITLLKDSEANSSNIIQSLRDLVNQTKEDDSVLIYYAGHGELEKITGSGYWVPHNARGGDVSTYMDNSIIQKYIKAMPARHILLVADSCFSGTLFGEARSLPPINNKFYATLYKEKSRWGMTSGNRTPVSDSGSGGHSIFAYHFLKALKEGEKSYITPREIYQRIGPIVRNNSEQMPITKPIKNTGDEGGEFVFIRTAALGMGSQETVSIPEPPKPPTVSSPPDPVILQGHLQVNVNVPVNVQVDGEQKGTASPGSPLNLRDLSTGTVMVRLEAEGYQPMERSVTIQRGQWTQEVFELKRERVASIPPLQRSGIVNLQKAISNTKSWKNFFAGFKNDFNKQKIGIEQWRNKFPKMLEDLKKPSYFLNPKLKRKKEDQFRKEKKEFERYVEDQNKRFAAKEKEMTTIFFKRMGKVIKKIEKEKQVTIENGNVDTHSKDVLDFTDLATKTYDLMY